jgi:hypothetical protein
MISSMTGSYVGYSLPFRPILPERLSRTLWNLKCTKREIHVEGGELNAKASRISITRTEGFYTVPLKIPAQRSGLQKAIS